MRFDQLRWKKPATDTDHKDLDTDHLTEAWLAGEDLPKTPTTVLERFREALGRNPMIGVGFTAASLIVTACSSDLFQQKPGTESAPTVEKIPPTLVDQIEITERDDEIVMVLGVEHSIRITDWAHREQWDRNLVPETGNPTFAWHRDVLEQQYADSFNVAAPVVGSDPMFMKPGEYPSFADSYGNMNIGNEAVVIPAFVDLWINTANAELEKNFDEESDLSDLTAAEWMYVLQAPTKLLKYDKRLASIFPEYDEAFTEAHWNKTIEELMRDGIGVCRDNERLTVTSYIVANQLFDLADNGLLYLPMVNVIDAKHTRGAFYLSINPIDMVVIGVDTTYGEGNIQNSLNAVSQADAAVWHSQQYDKDLSLTTAARIEGIDLFREYADARGLKLPLTAEAILDRQTLKAQIDLLLSDDFKRAGTTQQKDLIRNIYQNLLAQVSRDSVTATFPLNLPSRLVSLYDSLIIVAQKYDTMEGGEGTYEATAKAEFMDYLKKSGIDPEKARRLTHQIDTLPQDERTKRLQKIQEILEKYQHL